MRKAGRVENFQPHMHLRGKAMMVEAILPNGTEQMLGKVSELQFNWMNNYVFADDYAPLLPKGTILKITAWHDNTTANKSNPDPNQWVGWGDRTVDEMAHAWINITYMNDEDFTGRSREAQGQADDDHRSRAAAAVTAPVVQQGGAAPGTPLSFLPRVRSPSSFLFGEHRMHATDRFSRALRVARARSGLALVGTGSYPPSSCPSTRSRKRARR